MPNQNNTGPLWGSTWTNSGTSWAGLSDNPFSSYQQQRPVSWPSATHEVSQSEIINELRQIEAMRRERERRFIQTVWHDEEPQPVTPVEEPFGGSALQRAVDTLNEWRASVKRKPEPSPEVRVTKTKNFRPLAHIAAKEPNHDHEQRSIRMGIRRMVHRIVHRNVPNAKQVTAK